MNQMKFLCSFLFITGVFNKELLVSNLGKNVNGCGALDQPACRTLKYAIEQASNDDVVVVDNTFRMTYFINGSIEIKKNLTLRCRYDFQKLPVIQSAMNDTPIFSVASKECHLTISKLKFQMSRIIRAAHGSNIIIRYSSFENLQQLLAVVRSKSHFPRNHIIISFCNFSTLINDSVYSLIHIDSVGSTFLFVEQSSFYHSGTWRIWNYEAGDLNIRLRKSIFKGINSASNINIDSHSSNKRCKLYVSNCIFSNLHIGLLNSDLEMRDSILDGYDVLHTVYADQMLTLVNSSGNSLIYSTRFVNAKYGAVLLKHCSNCKIVKCTFQDNVQNENGGAILNIESDLFIESSIFINNVADNKGGTICSIGDKNVSIRNSFITGPKTTPSALGTIIYSSSNFKVYQLTINAAKTPDQTNPLIIFGEKNTMSCLANFTFICPINSNIHAYIGSNVFQMKEYTVYCKRCDNGLYSLDSGKQFVSTYNYPGQNFISNILCVPCPSEAICEGKIKSRDNYWGYHEEVNQRIEFLLCPPYYCCSRYGNPCYSFDTCNHNRTGILCGACKANHSFSIMGNTCVADDHCKDKWFWWIYGIAGIVVVLFFLFLKDITRLLTRITTTTQNQCAFSELTTPLTDLRIYDLQRRSSAKVNISGMIKILFFFYQAFNILSVDTSAKRQLFHWGGTLKDVIISIFNFHINSAQHTVCPLVGLTSIGNEIMRVTFIFLTLFVVFILFVGNKAYEILSRKNKEEEATNHETVSPLLIRIQCCFIQLLLLGYAQAAIFSFKVIHCVTINNTKHLYIGATNVCYQPWQYLIIIFISCWVVPFPVALYYGSYMLQENTITTKKFLRLLMVPISLPYFIIKSKICGVQNTETSITNSKIFLDLIYEPYRKSKNGRYLLWEVVLIFRRLVMIIVEIFVLQPVKGLYIILIMLFVFLWTHIKMQPFETTLLNEVEKLSLMLLCLVASINVLWGISADYDIFNTLELYKFSKVMLLMEIMIQLLPLIVLLCLLIGFCINKCYRRCRLKCD